MCLIVIYLISGLFADTDIPCYDPVVAYNAEFVNASNKVSIERDMYSWDIRFNSIRRRLDAYDFRNVGFLFCAYALFFIT